MNTQVNGVQLLIGMDFYDTAASNIPVVGTTNPRGCLMQEKQRDRLEQEAWFMLLAASMGGCALS